MTNPTHKAPRFGLNKATANHSANPDDDLILADLQTTTDDSELKITPLRHWQDDEDEIEQIMVQPGFDEGVQTHVEPEWSDVDNDPIVPVVEMAHTHQTEILPAAHPAQTNARIEPRLGVIDEIIEAPIPNLTIPTAELTQPSEKTELFEITPFITSYLAVRSDLQAVPDPEPNIQSEQAEYEQAIPEIAQTQATVEATDTLIAPPQPASPEKLVEAISFDNNELIDEPQQIDFSEKTATARPLPVIAQKAQLPVWQVMLLLTMLSLLLVTTYQLTTTVIALKSDMARLSALLEVVKDDVEALNQK